MNISFSYLHTAMAAFAYIMMSMNVLTVFYTTALLLTLGILPHQSSSKTELNVAGLNGIFFFEASGCADLTLFLHSSSFSRRPSNYLKISLFRHGSVSQASALPKENVVSAHVVW